MSEKNLPPSEQRKRQSRESGELGLSQELSKFIKFALFAEILFGTEPLWRNMLDGYVRVAIAAIAQPGRARLDGAWSTFTSSVLLMVVLAGAAAVVSVFTVLGQSNFNIASKAFDNGFKKLDIASNLKNLISPQKLMMAGLGPLKVAALLTPGYFHIRDTLPQLAQLYRLSPQQGWETAVQMLHQVERECLGVLLVLVVADVALQRFMNYRKMRMDMEEVKRDHKESEGDPHVKGKRKEVAKEVALQDGPMRAPGADALVVNPQHFAVALAYNAASHGLPRIVDKGRDGDAELLRAIAVRRGIPIIRYEGLARQLYATGRRGAFVPRHTLRAVALFYRAVQELSGKPLEGMHEIDEELGQAMLAGGGGKLAGTPPWDPAARRPPPLEKGRTDAKNPPASDTEPA